jgi:ribosome biogenesis protein UTP30
MTATAPPPPAAAALVAAAARLPGLRREQVDRAVGALLRHAADERERHASVTLFGDDDDLIYVTVALKRSPQPGGPKKVKPIRIPVPHPLASASGAEVCLFVKDKAGEGHKAAKARLARFEGRGGVAKVVGLSKLRGKYESHEARRKLCGSYDLFLADERVLPSLPKLLGKAFFRRRKAPIPVDLTAPNFPDQVRRAVEESTFMAPPAGSCVTVRAARTGMGPAAAAENVLAVVAGVAARVPKKWANVQAVYVKTGDSVALPVFQTLPDKPLRIGGGAEGGEAGGEAGAGAAAPTAGGAMDESGDEEDEEDEEEEAARPKKKAKAAAKPAPKPAAKAVAKPAAKPAAKAAAKPAKAAAAAAAGGGKQQQQAAQAKQKPAHGGRKRH